MTPQAKKLLSYLLKLSILVLAVLFIYHRLLKNSDNLQKFKNIAAHLDYNNIIIILVLIVLLMLLNWLLESLKWWHLTRIIAPMSVWKAIEAVFCGLTWAVFTPNRIGEYGGRVMFLPNRRRIHGVFAMAVGSFGQNVITNVLGAAAGVWFLYSFIHLNSWLMLGITVIAAVFMGLMLACYFNIKWMVSMLNSIRFLKKYHRFFDIMAKYKTGELIKIMGFCLARFIVFTFQYYLIIHLLIPQMPFFEMCLIMFLFFFIQSAMPSLDLWDIGVRSVTAETLFGYVTDQRVAVVVAVSLIYITNLIVPALIGTIFVFKLKFFDRTY